MSVAQETTPKTEVLAGIDATYEPAKEIFRRDGTMQESENSICHLVGMKREGSPASKKTATPSSKYGRVSPVRKDGAVPKKSNSGIPLRLKSGSSTSKTQQVVKSGTTYRHPTPSVNLGPVINKNTLEVQFMNNKKRLLQLHHDLVEKQRPLMDMHKSLMRTKKQLEDLGKKVVLEDLKIVSLKTDERSFPFEQDHGAGETPVAETAMHLKSSIDNVLESCVKVCQKCFVKRDDVMKLLENMSRSDLGHMHFEEEVEFLKRERTELERSFEETVNENEKKIDDLINTWQKSTISKSANDELTNRIAELDEKVKQLQKSLIEAEDTNHSLNRKYEDKKANLEKTTNEFQEKIAKLEEEIKKEKKTAADNLMKARNFRGKLSEFENKSKEADEKCNDTATKLKQLQEKLRQKEIQWIKEKDDFKKNEALLQQKFIEKQSQFDTRVKELENNHNLSWKKKEELMQSLETQLEMKDHAYADLEQERVNLSARTKEMEKQIRAVQEQLEAKDREILELTTKMNQGDYRVTDNQWAEVVEYKRKISEVQNSLKQQSEQIGKMQSSLKAHAQLAVALKLEKDNAIKYSNKLRDILQEARDEIESKNRTIYKIHEKLVLKESTCEKLKTELKELETNTICGNPRNQNRCNLCMSMLGSAAGGGKSGDCHSCMEDSDVGIPVGSCQAQYVSESLIGMSVKKVDHLRARLDTLKKLKLPVQKRVTTKLNCSWSDDSCSPTSSAPGAVNSGHLRRQIELRGKLYQILQKHADQSCEDFINLLKLTVSNSGKGGLKPSNLEQCDHDKNHNYFHDRQQQVPQQTIADESDNENYGEPRFSSNIKITKSYNTMSQFFKRGPLYQMYNESVILEDDDVTDVNDYGQEE